MSGERFEDEDEQLKKNISSFWVKAMMSLVAYCAQKFRRKQLVAIVKQYAFNVYGTKPEIPGLVKLINFVTKEPFFLSMNTEFLNDDELVDVVTESGILPKTLGLISCFLLNLFTSFLNILFFFWNKLK